MARETVKQQAFVFLNKYFPQLFINNGAYWDRYVRRWKLNKNNREYETVGEEWKGEELFLQLLDECCAGADVAIEIGCGGGRITKRAASVAKQVTACDVSKQMLKECERFVAQCLNVQTHGIDGFTLKEFADGSADVVFSHDVFVHFSSLQVYAYLKEIRRVLKADGKLLISFYSFRKHFELFQELSDKYASAHIMPPHMRVHFLSEEMLTHFLNELGFEIVKIDTSNFMIALARKPA